MSQKRWAAASTLSAPDSSWAMRASRASTSALVTPSNFRRPSSEHEPRVDVEAGALVALGDGDTQGVVTAEEGEPDPASHRVVPAPRRLSADPDPAHVGEPEDAH